MCICFMLEKLGQASEVISLWAHEDFFTSYQPIPFSMNRTQFGFTVPHLSREEKEDQQLCQKPFLRMFIA